MTVRQLVCLLASLSVLPHCATTEPAERAQPDVPEVTRDPSGQRRIPDSRQPTADELAAAFDPQTPAPATNAAQPTRATAPAPVDPLADQKQAFEAQAQQAQRAIADRTEDAQTVAAGLSALAEPLGPAWVTRAWTLRAEAALATDDEVHAVAHAQYWLKSCGPDRVDRCRREALRMMERAARSGPHAKKTKKRIAELRSADACLVDAEAVAKRQHGELPKCLGAAQRLYRAQRDRLMIARAAIAQAEATLADPKHADRGLRALQRAETLCTEARCAQVRRAALQRLVTAELDQGDPFAAARAAIREMQVYASTLPPADRPYAWTEAMDRACAALDAEHGPGSCRTLEQRETGALTFRDYSKQSAGEGLGADVVRTVNAHYGVTFQTCLASEAERLRKPAQARYTVRWVVLNDGRVGEMHMDRKERDDGPLADCLRRKLTVWRYPRYAGEYQHVEQSFVVTAQTRP